VTEVSAKFRALTGPARTVERALLIALTLVGGTWAAQLHHALPVALFNEQYLGLFLALGLAPVFLAVRASARAPADAVPWYDGLAPLGSLLAGGSIVVFYPSIAYSLAVLSWDKLALGALAMALVLESVRRLAGWALMWIAAACILYAKLAGARRPVRGSRARRAAPAHASLLPEVSSLG
jgi:TRAP-type uncharacterized transport system fused permease subunit